MRRVKSRSVHGCRVRRLPSGASEVERHIERPLGSRARAAVRRWCHPDAMIGNDVVRYHCHRDQVERTTAMLALAIDAAGADIPRLEPERQRGPWVDLTEARRQCEVAPRRHRLTDTELQDQIYEIIALHPGVTLQGLPYTTGESQDRVNAVVDVLVQARVIEFMDHRKLRAVEREQERKA